MSADTVAGVVQHVERMRLVMDETPVDWLTIAGAGKDHSWVDRPGAFKVGQRVSLALDADGDLVGVSPLGGV